MAIIPGDMYMTCRDCGAQQVRRSEMKYNQRYKGYVCKFHIYQLRDEEYKEYKVHLAKMTYKSHIPDVFRTDAQYWQDIITTWENISTNWEET